VTDVTRDEQIEAVDTASWPATTAPSDADLVRQLMDRARTEGVSLVGPGGLLPGLTKTVLEAALEAEMTEHVGYEPHDRAGHHSGNARNGTRSKTVVTDTGPVAFDVPRDRKATFEPKMVRKRQRRLSGVDDLVVSLVAKGLTTGEVQAHLGEVYGAEVSRDTISTITDRVVETMVEWQHRPLDRRLTRSSGRRAIGRRTMATLPTPPYSGRRSPWWRPTWPARWSMSPRGRGEVRVQHDRTFGKQTLVGNDRRRGRRQSIGQIMPRAP
jgi:hypothetical protein